MDYNEALYQFWSGFQYGGKPLKAYKNGYVPKDEPFPFITFETIQGEAFSSSVLTAFVWCKDQAGRITANEQRAAIMDDVAHAIPPIVGRKLPFEGGFVMLYRNDSDFLSDYTDPDETKPTDLAVVLGGRISYIARFYCY